MILQGFNGAVHALLEDGIVEPRCGVHGVELLGGGKLGCRQGLSLLLIVGLAQIAADEGIVHVEARGDFDFLAAFLKVPLADLRKPETEPRKRIGRVEGDGLLEGGP